MNSIFWGSGRLGRRTYDYIKALDYVEIAAIFRDEALDKAFGRKSDREIEYNVEVPFVSTEELRLLNGKVHIDCAIIASDNELLDFCVRRIKECGIFKIAIVPSYYEALELSDESFIWIEADKPRLPYIEYHVSFHCNLKCAGCTHFSNIIPTERFGDFDKFCDDLIRLQEMFWGIGKIRLLGGEPLLNHELPKFVMAARMAFPDADIRVVSNGLLLRDTHTELLNAMRETNTYFDVSMYPPTVSCINRIADICNNHGVRLTTTQEITDFWAGMNIHGKNDPETSFNSCPASHCAYLCDGTISTCALPQLTYIYNEQYGFDIKPGKDDVVDIYDPELDGYKLIKKLRSPMDICRYCDPDRRTFKWFVSKNPVPEEWISDTAKQLQGN